VGEQAKLEIGTIILEWSPWTPWRDVLLDNRGVPGQGVDSRPAGRLTVSTPGQSVQGERGLVAVRKRRPGLRRLDLDDVIAHRHDQGDQFVLIRPGNVELLERRP
jgi:hypothetical protein